MTDSTQTACSLVTSSTQGAIAPSEAHALIEQGVALIDVRRAQIREGQPRLANAAWIPFPDVEAYFASGKASELNIDAHDQPIVLFCATGAGSAQNVDQLRNLGYANTFYIEGGIQDWQVQGLPVIQP